MCIMLNRVWGANNFINTLSLSLPPDLLCEIATGSLTSAPSISVCLYIFLLPYHVNTFAG